MPRRLTACVLVFVIIATTGDSQAVTPIPAGALLRYKANYFNLEHKRLRFRLRGPAAYDLSVAPYSGPIDRGIPIGRPSEPRNYSWRTRLPFPFAFAGKKWDEVTINLNGTLTFGVAETTDYPERDTWSDGTMRSLASAFDVRAVTGERPMIVPLWGLNSAESTHIFTRSGHDRFAVTWQAVRYQGINEGYAPLGDSTFQVQLGRDGSIEFRYGEVAERDGIVGVFCGAGSSGKLLDEVDLPAADRSPEVDLRHVQVEDCGADLRFRLTFAGPIPSKASAGVINYGIVAVSQGEANVMRLTVDSVGTRSDPFCLDVNPHDQVVPIDCTHSTMAIPIGRTIEFYLPRIALKDPSRMEWKAEIRKNDTTGPKTTTRELRPLSLSVPMPYGFDFTRSSRLPSGNVYEVFHYPFLSKARTLTFWEIYKHASAEDDLAIAVTDFRIDDIHDHGASNSAGDLYGDPREMFNSPLLQQAAGPIYLGPRFREVIQDGSHTYLHFPFAVAWMAHEMTHRWVATLHWKDTNPLALLDTVQKWHWNPLLVTTVVTPVSTYFADQPYLEESLMGGMTVVKLPDGRMQSRLAPWGAPTGLCALDLYAMGLIGPDQVPDTFFISGVVADGNGGYKDGDVVPVCIADIIAANGPRVPAAKDSQHRFRFEIYLLYEDGRQPDAAKLDQARGIQASVAQYFTLATNGRMTVVPTR
jgi:hypothetical protein